VPEDEHQARKLFPQERAKSPNTDWESRNRIRGGPCSAPSGQQILAETRGASLLNLLIFCVARGRIRDPSLDTLPPPSGLPRAVH
jgi:hypothetical protein